MNDIFSLYEGTNETKKQNFKNSISSTLSVKENYDKTTYDDTWLCKMEETIRYLDNILRNPNRFIVNEEEIVKIELARRITVDSIKHLSRNTNFIQEYNKDTGEVRPSKILNINKEESFNTYENRFIYSLINNMKMYIEKKKNEDLEDGHIKDDKFFQYHGQAGNNKEKVEISVNLSSKFSSAETNSKKGDLTERINKVEEQIRDLTSSEVYKNLAKLHVALVTSPIKKTNLILKNTNFQYALDLWNYLQSHMESSSAKEKENKNYEDNSKLKEMMDQSFTLNYLIMQTLNKEEVTDEEKETIKEKAVNNMVNQVLNVEDIPLDELMKLVGNHYVKEKRKKGVSTDEIEKVYKDAINNYINKIDNVRVKNEK